MSNSNVIHDVSLTLKKLLQPVCGDVTVDSPHRAAMHPTRLNLFLYSITIDENLRNTGWVELGRKPGTPKSKRPDPATFAPEPLALRLHYLLTPFAADGLTEHQLLGGAMRVLYDNQRPKARDLHGSLRHGIMAEHVSIVLSNLDIDMIQRIWGQTTEFLRTSVAYEVSGIYLESLAPDARVPLVKEVDDHLKPEMKKPLEPTRKP